MKKTEVKELTEERVREIVREEIRQVGRDRLNFALNYFVPKGEERRKLERCFPSLFS